MIPAKNPKTSGWSSGNCWRYSSGRRRLCAARSTRQDELHAGRHHRAILGDVRPDCPHRRRMPRASTWRFSTSGMT